MTGRTISHYQILEKLGEGGMGVVYKARDSHLDRFVAIKVLPPEKVADPERKRRFVQEAKAASALSHANIIHIYDIDQFEGIDFISMEFVAGKTLDDRIPRNGVHLKDALKYAAQIADALAAAHGVGIVHRDLKPGNVMVTGEGRVKILDFGLAKLTETLPAKRDDEISTALTKESRIVGTAAYMSPEQAEGKPVDARSDIFSFGSLLYEMVTGRRAFEGNSTMSTLVAITCRNPEPLGSNIPHDLERVITLCLRKEPERRFQHMDDVKIALEELKEESDAGALRIAGAGRSKHRPWVLYAAYATAALAMVAAGAWFARPKTGAAEAPLVAVPLTSYPGTEDFPSFSPDGTQVAFQWCPEGPGKNCDVYIKQIGVEPPFRLTDTAEIEYNPVWSPDGRTIAFCRDLDGSSSRTALVLVPQRGGSERVLAELDYSGQRNILERPYLAWTPDSNWLVAPEIPRPGIPGLYLISAETGEKRRLTNPPPEVVGDTAPAFSPDGFTLAFSRVLEPSFRSDVWLLRLAEGYRPRGEPERIRSRTSYNLGATWTPDGKEILFASNEGLLRVTASQSGNPTKVSFAPDRVVAPAISRQGGRLAYSVLAEDSNIWRVDLRDPGSSPGTPIRFISSTRGDLNPAYSPDGKKVAFVSDRSGFLEIWVCAAEGSTPVQLTSFKGPEVMGPKWSPDGQRIAFLAAPGGNRDVYVINANGGPPRRLTSDPTSDQWPSWSQDGQWLYFQSNRLGTSDIWKMPANGGKAVQLTRDDGADLPRESPDGKFVYYSKGWPFPQSVWRIPAGGGQQTEVLDAVHAKGLWTLGKEGVYYFTVPDKQGNSDLSMYEFATGKTRKILTTERPLSMSIAVSPDDRTILYPQVDETGSDLVLVENFR